MYICMYVWTEERACEGIADARVSAADLGVHRGQCSIPAAVFASQ